MGNVGVGNSRWYRIQPKIWEVVIFEFGESAARVQQLIRENKEDWSLTSDMGWSTTGRDAKHGSGPVTWFENKLIVMHEVRSKPFTRKGAVIQAGNHTGQYVYI